jgi:tetratricopeptide (TPR) repeat protein
MLLATKMAYSNTASIVRRYRDLSFKAAEENDLATVSLCTRKLQQLGVSTDQSEYFAAIKLEEDNKISEAVERMQQLAGLERARDGELGFAPAHYWMASRLLNGAIELPRAAQLAQAEEHLKYFDDLEPESSASDGLWAQVYSATGRLTLSTERLRKLVDRVPELSFDLFSMSLIAGDLTNARQDALKLKKHFETLDYKAFSVLEFIRWAQAHEITSDLAGARSVLGKGREVWPDNQQLAVLAGRSSLAQYDSIANIQSAPAERRVQLLQDALSTKAVDKDVMQRVAYLYRQRNSSRIADLTLTRLLEDANTPGTIHLHLGSAAAMEGDTETARKLMQRSLELAPDSPLAHNNYAWLQSNSEPLNLPAALKLINRAVELDPVDYRFRETRGKIYLAMEDWEKAVEDLEYAINGLPNLEGVHESLASAYRKLGKTELALAHEAEAKPKQ